MIQFSKVNGEDDEGDKDGDKAKVQEVVGNLHLHRPHSHDGELPRGPRHGRSESREEGGSSVGHGHGHGHGHHHLGMEDWDSSAIDDVKVGHRRQVVGILVSSVCWLDFLAYC